MQKAIPIKHPKVNKGTSPFRLEGSWTKEKFETLQREAGKDSNVQAFDAKQHRFVIDIRELTWIDE